MVELSEKEKFVISKTKKFLCGMLQTDQTHTTSAYSYSTAKNIIRTLAEVLGLKEEELPSTFQLKCKSDGTDSVRTDELINFVEKLYEHVSTEHSTYDDGISTISRLFNLDEAHRVALEYIVLLTSSGYTRDLFRCVGIDLAYGFHTCYVKPRFVTSEWSYDFWVDFTNYGFITDTSSLSSTSTFRKLINSFSERNEQRITEILVGNPEIATYSLNDFKWVKDYTPIVKKLLLNSVKQKVRGVNILLYGNPGTGKTEFAKALVESCGLKCYTVRTENEQGKCLSQDGKMHDLAVKQVLLQTKGNSCILFDEAEDVMSKDYLSKDGIGKNYLNRVLEHALVPVIWTTNSVLVDPAFLRRMTYCIEFKDLTTRQRKDVWRAELNKLNYDLPNDSLTDLVRTYNVPVSIISNAVKCTKLINGNEKQLKSFIESIGNVALSSGYKLQPKKKATKLPYFEKYVRTDIDLPLLTDRLVKANNLNFSMCLYGEPGTGKSYYAKHLAKLLKVKVIYKKASDLMSPFVGETEHNIAKAFAEAEKAKAMLIFDEADSFLQNRERAMRSWEVTQVNEMLTQMENAKYPFVCTTNLIESLDEASLRRFTFKVKFDFMGETETKEVLKNMFKINNSEHIKNLTIGDCTTVKKKAKFLKVTNPIEVIDMLKEEVKIKKSANLSKVGF